MPHMSIATSCVRLSEALRNRLQDRRRAEMHPISRAGGTTSLRMAAAGGTMAAGMEILARYAVMPLLGLIRYLVPVARLQYTPISCSCRASASETSLV